MIPKTAFRVYKTSDAKTIIESPWRDEENFLEINDSGVSVISSFQQQTVTSSQEIMGLIGTIELSLGKYLLVVTSRTLACTIQSHKIWRITGGLCIPIGGTDKFYSAGSPKTNELDETELGKFAIDQELLAPIKQIIHSGRLYYSMTYDLTHSLQHNYFSKAAKPSSTVIDDRYFFNEYLLSSITKANSKENNTSKWVTKVIAGFAGMVEMDYKSEEKPRTYHVVLISRINHRRLGTRYVRRGLDNEGNAANNVEMEQIVYHHDYLKDKSISSYCQLRGSVPTIWGQDLDLSYRPRLLLTDINKDSIWAPTEKHFKDLKNQYVSEPSFSGSDNGAVVCVNLLDDVGFEGPLTDIYENIVKRIADPKIRYEGFSMHKWCKKMNYSNMDILLDRVRLPLINSGWLVAEGDVPSTFNKGTLRVSKIQSGSVRTSCLDSLDRTNLTCSIFARYMVPYQVQSISPGLPSVQVLPATGVSPTEVKDPVASSRKALEGGYPILTNLWADSGDSISLMYAGTGALKADVTRTGKRQVIQGSYADGLNSLTRYYLNNFTHGHLQDSYDLLTGKTSAQEVVQLAMTEGPKKASRLKRPLVPRNSFPGNIVPKQVLDIVEPVYFNLRESLEKKKDTQVGSSVKVVQMLKDLAPERIDNLIQLIFALTIFFWILVITKLSKIKGQLVVDYPRLTREKEKLLSMLK